MNLERCVVCGLLFQKQFDTESWYAEICDDCNPDFYGTHYDHNGVASDTRQA